MRVFSTYDNLKLQNILFEKKEGGVGLIKLNRPKAMNALCEKLVEELNIVLHEFDKDPDIGCIVITGSEKAFAAGADIKELKDLKYPATYQND